MESADRSKGEGDQGPDKKTQKAGKETGTRPSKGTGGPKGADRSKGEGDQGPDAEGRGIDMLEKHEEKSIDNFNNDKWEPMPRPLVIDSGAAETVIPSEWFPLHDIQESQGSKSGVYYTTADGTPVYNEGEKTLMMSTLDGEHTRRMTFQVAGVNKALGSVSKIVANGNRVIFDQNGSFIENVWTKDKIWLREDNGVYVLDMVVAPPEEKVESGFTRPGMQR
jgi:hypothetical protein